MKYAVIDIGSNSVRLMLWADGKSLYKKVETTRLGEGLARTGNLRPDAIERSAHAVKCFYEEGQALGAPVYAFATAAVRSAGNGRDFCARVLELCGLEVDVVPGRQEALLGLYGALKSSDGGIIDIGGASTEVCLRERGEITYSVSLDVGAVRLFDRCGDSAALLASAVGEAIATLACKPTGRMYVIGGTGSTLASVLLGLSTYDANKIQDLRMPLSDLETLAENLLSLRAEERKLLAGMDARRADIIAGGAMLLVSLMKKMSLTEVYASDRDNLEGYLTMRGLS